jgi:hypothetical protein
MADFESSSRVKSSCGNPYVRHVFGFRYILDRCSMRSTWEEITLALKKSPKQETCTSSQSFQIRMGRFCVENKKLAL